MTETELTLELRPWLDGKHTYVNLRGTMETIAQPKELRALLNALSLWSGAPAGRCVVCGRHEFRIVLDRAMGPRTGANPRAPPVPTAMLDQPGHVGPRGRP